ncbi:MAG: hypothetical protein R2722_17230 [Tessaracoccus sp.]
MSTKGMSLAARVEVTKKYATAYAAASKKDKSRILDTVVAVTGWNRDHARQQPGPAGPAQGQSHRHDRCDRPAPHQTT